MALTTLTRQSPARAWLPSLYLKQGEYTQALAVHQNALHILLPSLGPDHQSVASAYGNMATLLKKDLRIHLRSLSAHHPEVAATYSNVTDVYNLLADRVKALVCYQEALKIELKAYDPEK